jgi:dimethylargininase
MPTRAIVRRPGSTYSSALTRQTPAPAIDLELAREQHAGYVRALRQTGLDVCELAPDDAHPDAVFVQDRACVLEERAIVGRSAVAAREGEETPILEVLRRHFPVARLEAPACLDWGDVLIEEQRLFVGLSDRTNEEAIRQLQLMLAPEWSLAAVPLPGNLLHLLSGCSYLGEGSLLAVDSLARFARDNGWNVVRVPPEEEAAANVLRLPDVVVMPAGYPETTEAIRRAGHRVHAVPVSEFEKRDGGVTCLSILY